MDFQKIEDIPKGIPAFELSPKNVFKFLFINRDQFREINYDEGTFKVEDLAWHATRCSSLEFYANYFWTIIFGIFYFLLIVLSDSIPTFEIKLINFYRAPFSEFSSIILWYVCLLYILWISYILLVILLVPIFHILFIWEYKKAAWLGGIFHTFSGLRKWYFEYFGHRTRNSFIFFLSYLIKICMVLWFIHIFFEINFSLSTKNGTEERMLSAIEFLYFFLATYTTLGYGDITPADNYSRLMVILLNIFTIISAIYWYNVISKGPKKLITADIDYLYDLHLHRIRKISKIVNKYVIQSEDKMQDGKIVCPMFHSKDPKNIGSVLVENCKVCRGQIYVDPRRAISGAAWPEIHVETFLRRIKVRSYK